MSLAAYLKKYGKDLVHGTEELGPAFPTESPRRLGGLLGQGGVKDKAGDIADELRGSISENPGRAMAGAGIAGLAAGRASEAEDQDTPGHKVDALLRKLGLG